MSPSPDELSPETAGRLPRRVVIIGRNESAWMAAALLGRWISRLNCRVSVISDGPPEEEFIAETTLPSIHGLTRNLGADEFELLRRSRGTFQLARQFSDWVREERDFWIPTINEDPNIGPARLFPAWLSERRAGRLLRPLHSYSVHWSASLAGKAPYGFSGDSLIRRRQAYSLQVHGTAFAGFLREQAAAAGVQEISGRVQSAGSNGRGGIAQVRLESGRAVPGDIFIDASGPESCLTEALRIPTVSWADSLLCDRYLRCRIAAPRQVPPFSRITAVPHGWSWKTACRGTVDCGLAFSSVLTDEDTAWNSLRELIRHDGMTELQNGAFDADSEKEPQQIRRSCGRLQSFRADNVVFIGSTACRPDPVLSAGRHLAQTGIELLTELFPQRLPEPVLTEEYNRRMTAAADELRDLSQFCYLASQRETGDFWRASAGTPVSSDLDHRMQLFSAAATFGRLRVSAVGEQYWQHIAAGCGRIPEATPAVPGAPDSATLQSALRQLLRTNDAALRDLPEHEDLLEWIHTAAESDRTVHRSA